MTDRAPRRHDLDALRASAMLLGIALHASLAYVPGIPWPVQDPHPAPWLGLLFLAIHGFRMPLFFLLSGFFTAMLWQRRGAAAMLAQRYKRVFVPLVLGSVTLLPLFTKLSVGPATPTNLDAEDERLVRAIRSHDAEAVAAALAAGADPNAADAEFRMPPLWLAAIEGDAAAARLLIDAGADPDGLGSDGRTPLHAAAFTGRRDVVDALLAAGAAPLPRGPAGDTPLDSARVDAGTTTLIAGAVRVSIDAPEVLEENRAAIRRLLANRAGLTPDAAAAPPAPRAPGPLDGLRAAYRDGLLSPRWSVPWPSRGEPQSLLLGDTFGYLWFLWFLCWFAILFVIVATVAGWLRVPLPPRRSIASPLALLWTVPLTLVPQAFMGIFTPAFGPDTSTSLVPQPHILAWYGVFFAYGALLFLVGDDDGAVGRRWPLALVAALLVCFPAGVATMSDPLATALPQVLYAWLMCFAAIGIFRRLVPRESRAWRYLSDSAYWLYLAHMPLLVVLQRAIAAWDLPGGVKFLLACVAATAILLSSYQLLVRHTPLGTLLNGPRDQPRSRAASDASS